MQTAKLWRRWSGIWLSRSAGKLIVFVLPSLWGSEEQVTASYINHRDKVTSLITERKILPAGSRVLLADDWMSTAATMQACTNLIEDAGRAGQVNQSRSDEQTIIEVCVANIRRGGDIADAISNTYGVARQGV